MFEEKNKKFSFNFVINYLEFEKNKDKSKTKKEHFFVVIRLIIPIQNE